MEAHNLLLQLLLLCVLFLMLWFAAVGWSLNAVVVFVISIFFYFVQNVKKKKKKSNIVSHLFLIQFFPFIRLSFISRWAMLFFTHFTKISIKSFLFRVANEIKPMRLK